MTMTVYDEANLDRLSNIITGTRRLFKSVQAPIELLRWAVDTIRTLRAEYETAHTRG